MSKFFELISRYKDAICVPEDLDALRSGLSNVLAEPELGKIDETLCQLGAICVDEEFRGPDDGTGDIWVVWRAMEEGRERYFKLTGWYQSCQGYEARDVFEVTRNAFTAPDWVRRNAVSAPRFVEIARTQSHSIVSSRGFESGISSPALKVLGVRILDLCCRRIDSRCSCLEPWAVFETIEGSLSRRCKVVAWNSWMYGFSFKDVFEVEQFPVEKVEWQPMD